MAKTKSKTSPKGNGKGCLGDDGTYSIENCNGDLQNQGIGTTVEQSTAVINGVTRTATQ